MCNWVKRNYYFLSVLVPKRISPAPLNRHCGIPEKAIPPHPNPLPKEREKPAARRGKNAAPALQESRSAPRGFGSLTFCSPGGLRRDRCRAGFAGGPDHRVARGFGVG